MTKLQRGILLVCHIALLAGSGPSLRAEEYDIAATPIDRLRSNVAVDFVRDASGRVWVGTSNGVSYTTDNGASFYTFDATRGLNADNISSLFHRGDTIWLATATVVDAPGGLVISGGGIQYSGNAGLFWGTPPDTLKFRPADDLGLMGEATTGGFDVVYDITGGPASVFAACFAGGLIGSADAGVSWKRFHYSAADSVSYVNQSQPPYTSRYFSALADTSHGDSVLLFGGSAGGIVHYQFWPPRDKPSASKILDFALSPVDKTVFLAGVGGITRASWVKYDNWVSLYENDGLPSKIVNQIHVFGGYVFAGFMDSIDGDGVGFARIDKNLTTIEQVIGMNVDDVVLAPGGAVHDFADYQQVLYVAGGSAGLLATADTGASWIRLYTDTSTTSGASGRNWVYSARVDSLGDLWVGTDSGLVKLYVNETTLGRDSARYLTLKDTKRIAAVGGSGGSVRRIELQHFRFNDTAQAVDSSVIWAAAHPVSATTGEFATYRISPDSVVSDTILITSHTRQMAHRGSAIAFVGADGFRIMRSSNQTSPDIVFYLSDTSYTPRRIDTGTNCNSIIMIGDTLHVGKDFSFSVTTGGEFLPGGGTSAVNRFHVMRAVLSPFTADTIALHTSRDTTGGAELPGNFVVSLDAQYRVGKPTVLWAGCSPGPAELANRLEYDGAAKRTLAPGVQAWKSIPSLKFRVWNFGFNGDTIYAATDGGLYASPYPDSAFSRVTLASADPDVIIPSAATVNGVEVFGDRLWVASDEGIATRLLSETFFAIYRVVDSSATAPFAYPIPYSPNYGGDQKLKFSYTVPQGANAVSISIFDFAMNQVREINSDSPRTAGEVVAGRESDKWNGKTDDGDDVAPGMYYFRLQFSNGDIQWGKLVVIP